MSYRKQRLDDFEQAMIDHADEARSAMLSLVIAVTVGIVGLVVWAWVGWSWCSSFFCG